MDNFVITIARQYGSGGRTIGEMLAKKLNVHEGEFGKGKV